MSLFRRTHVPLFVSKQGVCLLLLCHISSRQSGRLILEFVFVTYDTFSIQILFGTRPIIVYAAVYTVLTLSTKPVALVLKSLKV